MLILTRRRGEAVDLIDRRTNQVVATVTLLELLPDNIVRLGFDAGPHIRIVRDNAINRRDDGDGSGKTQTQTSGY